MLVHLSKRGNAKLLHKKQRWLQSFIDRVRLNNQLAKTSSNNTFHILPFLLTLPTSTLANFKIEQKSSIPIEKTYVKVVLFDVLFILTISAQHQNNVHLCSEYMLVNEKIGKIQNVHKDIVMNSSLHWKFLSHFVCFHTLEYVKT